MYACIMGRDVVVGYGQKIFSNFETCAKLHLLSVELFQILACSLLHLIKNIRYFFFEA